MFKSEVLYVKGMNISDTDDEDQWDDKKLNDAYDKAVRIANIEVAKRVAMSTNTASPSNEHNTDPVFFNKKEKLPAKSSLKKGQMPKASNDMAVDERPKEGMWKAGMSCRLVFSEDGLEYEAVIVRFVNTDDCVVRYLGYGNHELVSVDTLMPSHGEQARARQIVESRTAQPEDSYGTLSPTLDGLDLGCSDRMPSPDSMDRTSQKKKKSSKKKKNNRNQARNMNIDGFEFPEIPPMPNISMLRNQLGSTEMPMPPPPMAFTSSLDHSDSEDQAISSMLLSWYMSGYYTGLYQGMKRAKEGRRN